MIFTLKIKLKNVSKPPVWRKLAIPGEITLHTLHQVIQVAFGWENYHSYSFSPKGWGSKPDFTSGDPDEIDPEINHVPSAISLENAYKALGDKFIYIYDFGDDWQHEVVVEATKEGHLPRPILIGGKGACPPEDCGGPWGYEQLKKDGMVDENDFDLEDHQIMLNEEYDCDFEGTFLIDDF